MNEMIEKSYAKVNIFLKISNKREQYHELVSRFVKDGLPFKRTQKGGKAKKSENPIKHETILGVLLLIAFFALVFTNKTGIVEIYVFAVTIFIQSIPYISAIIMRYLELESIKNQKS
jgi:4-diphosphocytidyl-2C-methyl-D-erythritol kinase